MLEAQKLLKLEAMVEKRQEEEEPKGETIVGPSGEAVEQSLGNAPSFFLKSNYLFNHTPLVVSEFSCMSGLVSLTDESEKEEEVEEEIKVVRKEEHKVAVACFWMQVGGFLALAEEEVQGMLHEVSLFV